MASQMKRPAVAPRRRAPAQPLQPQRKSARVSGERAPGFVDDAYDDDYSGDDDDDDAPRRAWRATGRRAHIPQARPSDTLIAVGRAAPPPRRPARPEAACGHSITRCNEPRCADRATG